MPEHNLKRTMREVHLIGLGGPDARALAHRSATPEKGVHLIADPMLRVSNVIADHLSRSPAFLPRSHRAR
jgi:hypothetical protein